MSVFSKRAQGYLDEVADWLVETGYPYDWWNSVLPPEPLREAIEEAWVRDERKRWPDCPADEAEAIRMIVAEEGGWL